MDLLIRDFTLKDLDSFTKIFQMIEEFHRQHMPSRFREPNSDYASTLLNETIGDKRSKIFVAELNEKVVGYVQVMIKDMPNHPIINPGQFMSVEQLAVDSSFRRLGIGTALMKKAEDFAKEKGLKEIELNVWNFNSPAEKFYSESGYKPVRVYFSL